MTLRFSFLLLLGAFAFATIYGSANAFTLGPTSPGKWGEPGFGSPGGVVTYSFMANGVDLDGDANVALADFMPDGFKTEIEKAFAAWSAVANIQFEEIADAGEAFGAAQVSGDIRLGGYEFDGVGGVLSHAFFPPSNGGSRAGDLHFDAADNWKIGIGGPGFDVFTVAVHEIGHSIGLGHTRVRGALMNDAYNEARDGPQADDIDGARYIYGAPLIKTRNAALAAPVPLPATLPLLLGAALALAGAAFHRARSA